MKKNIFSRSVRSVRSVQNFFSAPLRLCAIILFVSLCLCGNSSAALAISNGGATNITATNAWLVGNLTGTNSTNAILTVFYGSGNGDTNPAGWLYSNVYGSASSTGLVSTLSTNLTPATWHYYRWQAVEGTNTAWAVAASNFTTLARLPTNFPDATGGIYQVVGTNGEWLAPTAVKVIAANGLATTGDLTGYVSTGNVTFLSVLLSMTNYVPVPSTSNWLSYDPITRTLSGCVTNVPSAAVSVVEKFAGNTPTVAGKVYQWSSGGWFAASASIETQCNGYIGLAVGTNSTTAGVQTFGALITTNTDLIPGRSIFVGAAAGSWTQTAPTNTGSFIRYIGAATKTNEVFIKPDGVWVEIQ